MDEVADDDAVFVADVGTPVIWAARYLRMNGKRRLIGSFSHGSMANALPQAIGIQAAQPGRQVVTLSGDGGLAMMFGELITLRQLNLPVKIVVFNNGALELRRIGDESGWLRQLRHRSRQPEFLNGCRRRSECTASEWIILTISPTRFGQPSTTTARRWSRS